MPMSWGLIWCLIGSQTQHTPNSSTSACPAILLHDCQSINTCTNHLLEGNCDIHYGLMPGIVCAIVISIAGSNPAWGCGVPCRLIPGPGKKSVQLWHVDVEMDGVDGQLVERDNGGKVQDVEYKPFLHSFFCEYRQRSLSSFCTKSLDILLVLQKLEQLFWASS